MGAGSLLNAEVACGTLRSRSRALWWVVKGLASAPPAWGDSKSRPMDGKKKEILGRIFSQGRLDIKKTIGVFDNRSTIEKIDIDFCGLHQKNKIHLEFIFGS